MRVLRDIGIIVILLVGTGWCQDYGMAEACRRNISALGERVESYHRDKGSLPKSIKDLKSSATIRCPASKQVYMYTRSSKSCTFSCMGSHHRKAGLSSGEPNAKYKKYGLRISNHYIGKPSYFGKLVRERSRAKEKVRNYTKRLKDVTEQIRVWKKKYKKKTGKAARNLKTESKALSVSKAHKPPKIKLSKPDKRKLTKSQIEDIKAWDRDVNNLVALTRTVESRYRQLKWLKSKSK